MSFGSLKLMYFRFLAWKKARSQNDDNIDISLTDLFEKRRHIRVAIIDDDSFPWIDTLKSRGYKVSYFADYEKKTSTTKIRDFSGFDVVLCDINGIAKNLYPQSQGLSAMEDLRKKNPFMLIIAYTGSPSSIYRKKSSNDAIDRIFLRDWQDDDFIQNFENACNVFYKPQDRWAFLKKRLEYLGVKEKMLHKIYLSYLKNLFFCQLTKNRLNYSYESTKQLIINSKESFDLSKIIKITPMVIRLSTMFGSLYFKE